MSESQGNSPPNGEQGSGAPGAPSGSESAFAFKSEEEFNERLNRVITARQKDLEKKLDGRFAEVQTGITGFSSKFDEFGKVLEGLKPKDEPKGKDKGDAPAFKLEDQPEWKAHQAELATLKRKAEAAEQAATQERQKNRTASMRARLSDGLTKAGIPADRQKHAMSFLNSEGVVSYSDEGKGDTIVWRSAEGDEIPLDEGLASWAKTSDAKVYLPPKDPGGSGGTRGRSASSGGESFDDQVTAAIHKSWNT